MTSVPLTFSDQLIVVGGSSSFSDAGDSGSLIVDQTTKRPVGLLFGGPTNYTIANHIEDVLHLWSDCGCRALGLDEVASGPAACSWTCRQRNRAMRSLVTAAAGIMIIFDIKNYNIRHNYWRPYSRGLPTSTAGGLYRGLAVGDVNEDGRPDIAVANILTGPEIYLQTKDGAWQPTPPLQSSLKGGATALALGDLDGVATWIWWQAVASL